MDYEVIVFLILGFLSGGVLVFFIMNRKINSIKDEYSKILTERAVLSEKSSRLSLIENELVETRKNLSMKNAEAEKLSGEFEQFKQITDVRIKELNDAKYQFKLEFENLANRIFEEKGKVFSEQNSKNIDSVLNPLKEQIVEFKKRVESVYESETRDRVGLREQVYQLRELNKQLSEDAQNLTGALKRDTKLQGHWGEVTLERIFESSGLTKGIEFELQVQSKDSSGSSFRPDAVVRLPENKDIVIDAKVSLTAYEQFCSAKTEEERNSALKLHIKSIRSHIDGLKNKPYTQLEGLNNLDYILMFVPIDGAFSIAIGSDNKIFDYAYENNIIMVSPSTLLVTLRTINNIWKQEKQSRNAQEIANKAGELYDKLVGFLDDFERIGKSIEKAGEQFSESKKKLSTGKGNLLKKAQSMKELGINNSKEIPQGFSNLFDESDDSEKNILEGKN
ncbi:MAG: DNA recombination protein RmuC [Ignavibacteriaceae bacterium]|nr:DNA recombination protein RmuC [Ignavibacteriaceae bacterium]